MLTLVIISNKHQALQHCTKAVIGNGSSDGANTDEPPNVQDTFYSSRESYGDAGSGRARAGGLSCSLSPRFGVARGQQSATETPRPENPAGLFPSPHRVTSGARPAAPRHLGRPGRRPREEPLP